MKLLSLALLPLAACAATPSQPVTPPADPHSFARPELVRVEHVALDLTLDFDAEAIAGEVRLNIAREDPSAPLVLDVDGIDVQGAAGADGTPRDWRLGEGRAGLGRPLVIELRDGDDAVAVRYRTAPGAAALQWLAPEQTAGGEHPFLFTQGQSILTRTWIPLQDSPGVRVTYEARVRVAGEGAEALRVVMSAEQSSRDADGAYRFRMSHAIPPYLIALGCGDLAFRAISPRSGVWADPTVVDRAAAELEDTEAMIARAEELFGPYRWGRYDLLILPPAFPFGGMENPCLTFCTPTILAGDKSLVALVAHELAHSWSGNLVTNATWRDFWLNEGFTVYFEARIMERVFGEERASLEKVLARADLERELAELEPWAQVLHVDLDGRHPDDYFSNVPYEKGALFLRRVEELVGREDFDRFLSRWFDEHAFRSVTTGDFRRFLEGELLASHPDARAELDLDRWLEGTGLPDDAPRATSQGVARVDRELEKLRAGAEPRTLATAGWTTWQWVHFLEAQAETLDAPAMERLDRAFELTRAGNAEVLCVWLRLAVEKGYRAADERLERFVLDVGRAKFLRPLYKALVRASPERARALYERAKPRYHAVARSAVEEILRARG